MAKNSHFRFALCATLVGLFAMAGMLGAPQRAWAQERGSRDGEGRGGWRERFRDRGGDSDRGRDSRDGRSRDEESRRGDSSNGSGSSNSSSSTTSTESKPSSGGSSGSLNMTDYAKSLVKQYDKNDNKMLEADERKELRGRAAEADLNKDNVITIDELVAHLSSSAPATPTSTTSSSPSSTGSTSGDKAKSDSDKAKRVRYGSAGGAAASSKEGEKRHSYRFTPATQKLPSGLPGWFTSKDSNRDGQVSMNEYGRSWSERSVADFRKIDVNDDGVITPKEAAKSSSGG